MKTNPILFLAGSALALLISLTSCGGKKEPDDTAEDEGPQSTYGKMLDNAQKTADEANERVKKVHDELEKAQE